MKSFFLSLFFILSCNYKKFDSNSWKQKPSEQYYMVQDLVESNSLQGKTKAEVIQLIDTINMKNFHISDNEWMHIIAKPASTRATESPIIVLDISFQDNIVKKALIRK